MQLSIVVGFVRVVGRVAGAVGMVWLGGGLGEVGRGLLRGRFGCLRMLVSVEILRGWRAEDDCSDLQLLN